VANGGQNFCRPIYPHWALLKLNKIRFPIYPFTFISPPPPVHPSAPQKAHHPRRCCGSEPLYPAGGSGPPTAARRMGAHTRGWAQGPHPPLPPTTPPPLRGTKRVLRDRTLHAHSEIPLPGKKKGIKLTAPICLQSCVYPLDDIAPFSTTSKRCGK